MNGIIFWAATFAGTFAMIAGLKGWRVTAIASVMLFLILQVWEYLLKGHTYGSQGLAVIAGGVGFLLYLGLSTSQKTAATNMGILSGLFIVDATLAIMQPWTDPQQLLMLWIGVTVLGFIIAILGFYLYARGKEQRGKIWVAIGSSIGLIGLTIPLFMGR